MSKPAKDFSPSVKGHPRALRAIRRGKGWGGLTGFVLGAVLAWRAGLAVPDAALRALACGVGGYLLAWLAVVQVWRHLVVAEIRAIAKQVEQRAREVAEERAREQQSPPARDHMTSWSRSARSSR